jgi:Na+/H+-translocating membrane pyrophosphatase
MKQKHLLRNVAIANLVVAFILFATTELLFAVDSEAFHFLATLYICASSGYLGVTLSYSHNKNKAYKPTDKTVFFVILITLFLAFLCFGVQKLLHVSDTVTLYSVFTITVIGALTAAGIEIYGQAQVKRAKHVSKA